MLISRSVLCAAMLCLLVSPSPALGDDESTSELKDDLHAYLGALERAASFEATHGELGLVVRLFPDAYAYDVLSTLRREMDKGKQPEMVVGLLAKESKRLAKLLRQAGAQIELVHPSEIAKEKKTPEIFVHFFGADLRKSFELSLDGQRVNWKAWKQPSRLVTAQPRIAQYWTVRDRQQVPLVQPLKPKGKRAIFVGKRASVWCLVPAKLLQQERGELRLSVANYDEYHGTYDRRHVIDRNEPAYTFDRGKKIEVKGLFPVVFPQMPETVKGFLGQLAEGGQDSKG